MAFQSTVNFQSGFGVYGELYLDSPFRVDPYVLVSSPEPNVIGSTAYTVTSQAGEGYPAIAQAGSGGIAFAGILANPKVYASAGSSSDPLAATLTLPDNTQAELLTMGEMVVYLPGAANIGDRIVYNNTTGAISNVATTALFTGVIAVTTGVLTVSALSQGTLGVGSVILSSTGAILATITSLGTGTGGNGTYNTNIVTAVASASMSAASIAAPGYTMIDRAYVTRYTTTGAGAAVIKILN